jgi:hypothetical protein
MAPLRAARILTLAEKPVCVPRSLLALFDTQAIDRIGVCHYSRAHHAVVCYRRFPESARKTPNWRGSLRRFVLRDGIVTVGRSFLRVFLWPRNPVSRKRRPREAETRFECRVTPTEVRASGGAETTRRACRRGGPLPCHEAAARRWQLARDRAPERQARSSC